MAKVEPQSSYTTSDDKYKHLKQYNFNFENLAFEGGGIKMMAHIGVLEVLEELEVMPKLRRFAGTSAGAIIACVASVGMTTAEMEHIARTIDFEKNIQDARYGKLSFLCNVIKKFGWHPANRFLANLRQSLREKTGIDRITFKQVYEKYGKELCIVATNVSTMSPEYFHPKTTPDVEVAVAVRCSCTLPVHMQPPVVEFSGFRNYFSDGGICCSFPLHAFDGWYLSMELADSFFFKLGTADPPFGTFNPKTIGCLLMSAGDGDLYEGKLLARSASTPDRPNTKLARKNGALCEAIHQAAVLRQHTIEAGERLLCCMRNCDINLDAKLTAAQFKRAAGQLSADDQHLLFGSDDDHEASSLIENGVNNEVTHDDFVRIMQKKGLRFRALLEGGNMVKIEKLADFINSLSGILEYDLARTIGINTDYVQTTDFKLEEADQNFLIQQGRHACLDYLADMTQKSERGQLPSDFNGIITKLH